MDIADNSGRILLHIQMSAKAEDISKLDELARSSVDEWKKVVLAFDKIYNNFDEKTQDEWAWIDLVKELIKTTIPEEFKVGTHCLFERASFMGEDIYITHGNICTTIHASHKKCGTWKVLNWDHLYCAFCNEDVSSEDLDR